MAKTMDLETDGAFYVCARLEEERYGEAWVCEWRIRRVSEWEREQALASRLIVEREYGCAYWLERRMGKPGALVRWDLHGVARSVAEACDLDHGTDTERAQPLIEEWREAVEARLMRQGLRDRLASLKAELAGLEGRATAEYHDALKRARIFAKAMRGEAPQGKVDAIRAELLPRFKAERSALSRLISSLEREVSAA